MTSTSPRDLLPCLKNLRGRLPSRLFVEWFLVASKLLSLGSQKITGEFTARGIKSRKIYMWVLSNLQMITWKWLRKKLTLDNLVFCPKSFEYIIMMCHDSGHMTLVIYDDIHPLDDPSPKGLRNRWGAVQLASGRIHRKPSWFRYVGEFINNGYVLMYNNITLVQTTV